MKALFARFVRDDQGQDLIEYALLGSFVSLAVYVGANTLAGGLNDWYIAIETEANEAAAAVAGTITPAP